MFEPGTKNVDDYHKNMEITMVHANLVENKEATIARFLNGMNREIVNIMELQNYVELEDMMHMATKIERQLKRKGGSYPSQLLGSLSPWKLNFKVNMGGCPIFTKHGVDIRESKREKEYLHQ